MGYFKFPLGRTVITNTAKAKIDPVDIPRALHRHGSCDWGDVDEHDRKQNDQALAQNGRLLSVYRDRNGVKFFVITEADRSATTILLPEDY